MINETLVTTENKCCYGKCISWSAIFVGAVAAIGFGFLLHLFTSGLGLSLFTTDQAGLTTLAIGVFVWLIIATYFLMFFAGWITGSLTRFHFTKPCTGFLHGFAAWCVALILSIILVANLGTFITANSYSLYGVNTATPVSTVQVTTNDSAPAISAKKTSADTAQVVVNPEKATNNLGIGVLAIFFIFLIGAIGSTVGGYVGVKYCKNNCSRDTV